MRKVRAVFDPDGRANPKKAIPEEVSDAGLGLRAVRKAT
jgi:hypothetical protein